MTEHPPAGADEPEPEPAEATDLGYRDTAEERAYEEDGGQQPDEEAESTADDKG